MKPTVLVTFGTRPEALKLAPVIQALREQRRLRCVVCLTAQHREMVDQVIQQLRIPIHVDLNVMMANQTLDALSQRLFPKLTKVFKAFKPQLVVVQGDTTTAAVVALRAFYEKIPIAHVEAGLRSFDKLQPFPEEMNRRMISHLADLHFAPTQRAKENLLREGIQPVVLGLEEVAKSMTSSHG